MKSKQLEQICMQLQELHEDASVPRNIRRGAKEAREILRRDGESVDVRVASAITVLDDLVNDPNVPIHGRTAIWNIMSQLESVSRMNQ
ncbi:MAG: UPF0147 family protein [Candidatus Thermoplasmatota archaeon]|nr:UPF0147 family protein [Candidatus Thermoplasmatota archaeon]